MAAKNRSGYPGQSTFRQAMNCIGSLIFEKGLEGNLDMSVMTRRSGGVTTITILHGDGTINFAMTDAELEREKTPRQREATKLKKGGA
jgi:hypothetical protein